MKHRLELPTKSVHQHTWIVRSIDDYNKFLNHNGEIVNILYHGYWPTYDQAFQAREAYLSKDDEWTRPTHEEEYVGRDKRYTEEKEDQAFKELDKKLNSRPKQYRNGIDTFTRAKENMSIEGIMAATVMTVDAYIWRDKGTDYEDFCKARDWLNYCIKCMEEHK